MADRSWTPAQQQCLDSHGGTVLVSAAAGSGKTTVLIERILRRVLKTDSPTDIDRLLVVTFTNAASAEMKARLTKAFADAAAEAPHDVRIGKQQLLVPRADICTIDSFCIGLVREHFEALGIGPQFAILDNEKDKLLRSEALRETLEEFHTERKPAFMELYETLADGRGDGPLYGIVDTIYRYVQSYPDPEIWFERVREAYRVPDTIGKTPWGDVILKKVAAGLSRACALCRAALSLCMTDPDFMAQYAPMLEADIADFKAIIALAENGEWDRTFRALSLYAPIKLGTVKASAFPDVKDRIQSLRKTAKATVKKLADYHCGSEAECLDDLRFTARLIDVACALVRRFAAVFYQKKTEADAFGFDDIKHMALRLLTVRDGDALVPSPLAVELAERYDEILIDECQDINATDEALFVALSRQKTNLFMVGDVKQCIYAFRQAMPDIFLRYRREFPLFDDEHYPGTVILGHNFRSRRSVLDTTNFVFRQLMTPAFSNMAYDDSEALVYGGLYDEAVDETPYTTECLVVSGKESEGLSAHEAEAHLIAQRIREQVGVLPIGTKEQRPLGYGDVCILLRNFSSHAAIYRRVLAEYGIPVAASNRSEFFGSAEVRLVLSLLRAIDNPLNDIPLTAVLLSPLFGFTADDIAAVRITRTKVPLYTALCAAARSTEPLAARCQTVLRTLDRFRTLAVSLTVDRLINRLYEELSLPELICARYAGVGRAEKLHFLYEYSRRFEKGGFRGLSSFVRYVDRLLEQGVDLEFCAGSAAENAVQLMSAHGSKGLEFPVVFLSGLQDPFKGDDSRAAVLLHNVYGMGMKHRDPVTLNTYATLPYLGVRELNRRQTLSEELRILYVAMTRAREKLYLVTHVNDVPKTMLTLGACLDTDTAEQTADTVAGASSMSDWLLMALLRHPHAAVLREEAGLSDRAALCEPSALNVSIVSVQNEAVDQADDETAAEPDPVLLETLRHNRAYAYPHEALSRVPTKMAASRVADEVTPQNAALTRPAFMSKGGLTPAERGTAMHLFLQCADLKAAAVDLEAEITRLTAAHFLSTPQADALDRPRLKAFFESDLFRRMNDAEALYREYRFTFRTPASTYDATVTDENEFVVIQGMTDGVLIENGRLVLIDYKTDRVESADALRQRYAPQLHVYAEALERVLERPVGECLLYSFHLNRTIPV